MKLEYKLILESNIEYVFDKLFSTDIYPLWASCFGANNQIIGTINAGEKIRFTNDEQNGIESLVTKFKQNQVVEFQYCATITNDQIIVYEGEDIFERYTYASLGDEITMLTINVDLPDKYGNSIDRMWQQAITVIEDIFQTED